MIIEKFTSNKQESINRIEEKNQSKKPNENNFIGLF